MCNPTTKRNDKYLNTYIIHAKDILVLYDLLTHLQVYLSNPLSFCTPIALAVVRTTLMAHLDRSKKLLIDLSAFTLAP